MNTNSDPFESVRINKKKPEEIDEKLNENDPFQSVRIKKSEEIPGIYQVGRHATRIGSRIAEVVGGLGGDLSSLVSSGILSGIGKLTGNKFSEEEYDQLKNYRSPTSKELKKFSQEKTKGFTSPKNENEKRGDEIAETFASLIGPMKFRKTIGVTLASEAAKEGIKLSGFGEGAQEAGKLGTMFLATMFNPRGALNYSKSQFAIADKLSQGASINVTPFENNLKNLQTNLAKGINTTEKNLVIKSIDDLLSKIKNGKIEVNELTAAKRDLNSVMGDPSTLKGSKKLLKSVGKEIDNAIKPYEKINPGFGKAYRPANEIFGAVAEGNKAHNFIRKILGPKSVMASIIGETALGHPEYILPTIGIAGTSVLGAKTVDFFTRLSKSPELRKYYSKAALAAAKEDVGALRLYEGKIQNILQND
ncbi:MAG: hypothetical protein ABI554_02310 [Flavobacterium sp.]